ncbi:hypothetical protein DV736_g6065, partial [Chaetothyriales sp. CBS 134916]
MVAYAILLWTWSLALAHGWTIVESLRRQPELSTLAGYLSTSSNFSSWLSKNNITLLAPQNSAFEQSHRSATDAELAYHILRGAYSDFTQQEPYPIATLPQGAKDGGISGGQLVFLQGSGFSNRTTIWSGLQQPSYTTGTVINCMNGVVHIIDSLLTLPQNFSYSYEESAMYGPSPFVGAKLTAGNSTKKVSIDELSNITIFLPIYYAFEEIGSIVTKWTVKELNQILEYHILDKVLFTKDGHLPTNSYSSLGGTELSISNYNGDTYVNNAQVVSLNNWVFKGGIIYTIYGVLNPRNSRVKPSTDSFSIAFDNATFVADVTFANSKARRLSTGAKAAIGTGAVAAIAIFSVLGDIEATAMAWDKANLIIAYVMLWGDIPSMKSWATKAHWQRQGRELRTQLPQ